MIEYKNLSLAQQVYHMIEENILSGKYEIGKIISEKSLSAEMGVSRNLAADAMARLNREKLIKYTEDGAVVLGVTKEDLEDFFVIKRTIEVLASKMAAGRMSADGLKELKEILDRQEHYAQKSQVAKVIDLDTKFHDYIYMESGSPVFEGVLSTIHHKLKKYRLASLENENRIYESLKEHREIYNALCEGDAEKVEKLMLTHIENAYESMIGGK